jgi:hypothetical protein
LGFLTIKLRHEPALSCCEVALICDIVHELDRFIDELDLPSDGEGWVSIGRARIHMTYAIIRGNNGRRHEVDFGDSPVRVEVYASEETVEIFVEADSETLPEERRRFALINVPRDQFSHATGEAARRATRKDRYRRATSA